MGHFDTLLTVDQADAVRILHQPCDRLVAFGTGLGKTYVALASFEALRRSHPTKKFHLLVVCTKSATISWLNEIKDRACRYQYFLCYPEWKLEEYAPLVPGDEDITIVTYQEIENARFYLNKLFEGNNNVILVLDEMHKIKNKKLFKGAGKGKESKGESAYAICRYLRQKSLAIWGLTATPVLNKIEDIYTLIDFIFPKALGTKTNYMQNYAIVKRRKFGLKTFFEVTGYRNLNLLHERIKPYCIVKYKDFDVRFSTEKVILEKQEYLVYLRAAIGFLRSDYKEFAARLPDLQKVVDGSVLMGGSYNSDYSKYSSKEKSCVKKVSELLQKDRAVIVYSSLRDSIERLKNVFAKEFPNSSIFVITGSASLTYREKVVNEYKAGDILLMTGAGGESLNLQISNSIIFYNLTFNIGEFIQVVGRIVRANSIYDYMEVFIIEADDTIDTYKRLMLDHNAEKIKEILSENPNLPDSQFANTQKSFIIKIRKDLLWKKKELSKLDPADVQFVLSV